MLVLGSMIRLDGLFMALLAMVPLLIVLAWHLPRGALAVGATGAAMAGLLVTIGAWHHQRGVCE